MSRIPPDALNELCAVARETPPGDFIEVGVYQGGSAMRLAEIAREQGRDLFLCDTFTGIPFADPEKGDLHVVGDFSDTHVDAVRNMIPDAIFVVGVFPDSLRPFDAGPIALAHIDCDQYQSIKDCCEVLGSRMVPGGVMVFDDYESLPGAKLAVDECFAERVMVSRGGKAYVEF